MKSNPLVSVIVPTRNEEKLLPACLSSLKAQNTSVSYEIIVVDTKSTDKTLEIARGFGARIIAEPGKGKVYAFRKGAAAARGEILCFTEADCVVPLQWIQTIVDHFNTHKDVVAVCGTYTFHHSTPLYRFLAQFLLPIGHALHLLLYRHHHVRASNFAVRKSIYDAAGGFSLSVPELYDTEISYRLSRLGKIDVLPELQIETSDRRVRGRIPSYIGELFPALFSLVFRTPFTKRTYADIR